MIEGKSEQIALAAGQFIADRLAIIRINRGLRKDIYSFVSQNKTPFLLLLGLFRSALVESFRRKHLPAWPTLLMCGLLYGKVEPGWISATKYWTRFHRIWGGPTRSVSDVKTLTRKLIKSEHIPDLGYFVNGQFWNCNWEKTSLAIIADALASDEFVVKRDYSERGKHVKVMNINELTVFDFNSFGDCVIQRKIVQIPLLTKLSGGNTVTIRVLTGVIKTSEKPFVLASVIKFDAPNSSVRKNITFGVNLENYQPLGFGYDDKYKKFYSPNEFLESSKKLNWVKDAFELAIDAHSHFPHFQIIGWDIGIDENSKPWIFEWNADHPALIRAQGFYGPVHLKSGLITQAEVQ